MMKFEGSHILSVSQLNRDAISRILEVSSLMAPYAMRKKRCHVLDGAILNNLFFEPSTRTRVSFGAAFNLLGGAVRETVGQENSSLSKGESLFDTARVISGYSDIIELKSFQKAVVYRLLTAEMELMNTQHKPYLICLPCNLKWRHITKL
jgi:aspartate carbamoyltransferase catalytic subunit